jgi:hypothetical protein
VKTNSTQLFSAVENPDAGNNSLAGSSNDENQEENIPQLLPLKLHPNDLFLIDSIRACLFRPHRSLRKQASNINAFTKMQEWFTIQGSKNRSKFQKRLGSVLGW